MLLSVSRSLRFQILRRDNYTCRYCGRSAPDVPIEVDHVIPTALGGSDEAYNLVAACYDCNGGKSSTPADAALVENVADDAWRWTRAMRQAAEEVAAARAPLDEAIRIFYKCWQPYWLPANYATTIRNLITAGLTKDDLADLVEVALTRKVDNKWKYFCGCCWKRVKKLQERAFEILNEETGVNDLDKILSTRWTLGDLSCDRGQAFSAYAYAFSIDESHKKQLMRMLSEEHFMSTYVPCIGHGIHCDDPICISADNVFLSLAAAKEERSNAVVDEVLKLDNGTELIFGVVVV